VNENQMNKSENEEKEGKGINVEKRDSVKIRDEKTRNR
jgi:hypothetical protein